MSHLDLRRERTAQAWELSGGRVLIGAGDLVPIEGSGDQVYPFVPHPEYRYLTDCDQPGGVLEYDAANGWTHFVPPVTQDQRIWEGGGNPAEGEPIDALETEGALAWLGHPAGETDPEVTERLRDALRAVRRSKDAIELERMRRACAATARGFERLPELIRPGATERHVQIELEAGFFRAGGERTAYSTIVGGGPNAAVLHFPPSRRPFADGDLVLVDAGTEIEGYCADVTRTFPASGAFTPEQRALYDVVLDAQTAAIGRCRPGAEFREIHLAAALDVARGLEDLGILRGDPQSLVERDAHALFFPHGLGHMVGLGVRDGDSAPPRPRSERPGLKFLRLDCALEEGYTLTIEPGVYFIPALLDDPENRETYADCVDWARVDAMRDFGGIRIEDDVHVAAEGPEILTEAIPK